MVADIKRWLVGEGRTRSQLIVTTPSAWTRDYPIAKDAPLAEVYDLYVSPEQRGKGLADMLMGRLSRYADRSRLDLILRACPHGEEGPPLDRLMKFYRVHGFRKVQRGICTSPTWQVDPATVMLRRHQPKDHEYITTGNAK